MENNSKQLSSVNQLYQRSDERDKGISFKQWIDPLKKQWQEICNNPDTRPNCDFLTWLNDNQQFKEDIAFRKAEMKARNMHRQQQQQRMKPVSAEGEEFSNAADVEPPKNLKEQEARRTEALKNKNIFGMKPIAFYSITGAIAIAIGTGIYFYIKNRKK